MAEHERPYWGFPVHRVRVEEVIIVEVARGNDTTGLTPIRKVTQVWSKAGELIAEHDSRDGGVFSEDRMER